MIWSLEMLLSVSIRRSLRAAGLLPEVDGAGRVVKPAERDGPVLLFGGGQHTLWLARQRVEFRNGLLRVEAVIDDAASGGLAGPWPCVDGATARRLFGVPAAVILSTDVHQAKFAARAREIFGPEVVTVDLYAGLPPGPYAKETVPEVGVRGKVLDSATAEGLQRTGAALKPYLEAKGYWRVMPLGRDWQKAALARGLGPTIEITNEAGQADVAVTCADELEFPGPAERVVRVPGLAGPVLGLCNGERAWIDRSGWSPEATLKAGEAPRIAIWHDALLGDVILSQGILPERIKREVYPKAHITFYAHSRDASRPGSESTGWVIDVLRHNPWIDEIRDCGDYPGDLWADGFDKAYAIKYRVGLYEHMFDVLAMNAELPPGRTDAKVYLSPADRELAEEVVARLARGRRGPRVAVNMVLLAERVRGWGAAKTAELCGRLEKELGATIVWMGWQAFGPYQRLVDPRPGAEGRALSVREQAAAMRQCDLHITCQGGGANLSAAVECQTLALSGMHPAWREGVAYFHNEYIADRSRWHVEMYKYESADGSGDGLRVLNYGTRRRVPWRIGAAVTAGGREHDEAVDRHETEIWVATTPIERLPREEKAWWRVRDLTVDDVFTVARQMLEARQAGTCVPGE